MHRSIRYPASPDPPVSVDAVQVRFIWDVATANAARLVGLVGGVVSGMLTVTVRDWLKVVDPVHDSV